MRFIVAIALALTMGASLAQDYPNKPIRMLVPFAPGGAVGPAWLRGRRDLQQADGREPEAVRQLPGDQRAVLERQSGRAEGAFRRHAADIPMGPPATGAVIGLVVAIDDVVAALADRRDKAAAAGFKYARRHYIGSLLSNPQT